MASAKTEIVNFSAWKIFWSVMSGRRRTVFIALCGGTLLTWAVPVYDSFQSQWSRSLPQLEDAIPSFWIPYFIIGWICLSIIVTAILFFTGYPAFKSDFVKINTIPHDSQEINILLKGMNDRLFLLAHREAKRLFNPIRHSMVLGEANKRIGIVPEKMKDPYDKEEAKAITSEVENQVAKKIQNTTLMEQLPMLKEVSGYLESKGYGLKRAKAKDWQYIQYKNRIDILKNTYADDELSACIIDHIDISETMANWLLIKERGLRVASLFIRNDSNIRIERNNITDVMSFGAQARTEQLEDNILKILSQVRLAISKRINKLDNNKTTKQKHHKR